MIRTRHGRFVSDDRSVPATVDDVRETALSLPRAYEALVRDRVKFRVGKIVFAALSRDEETIGFGFPKEERDALVASRPDVFRLPRPSDLRYHWVEATLAALEPDELRELIVDAWAMCVPARVSNAWFATH